MNHPILDSIEDSNMVNNNLLHMLALNAPQVRVHQEIGDSPKKVGLTHVSWQWLTMRMYDLKYYVITNPFIYYIYKNKCCCSPFLWSLVGDLTWLFWEIGVWQRHVTHPKMAVYISFGYMGLTGSFLIEVKFILFTQAKNKTIVRHLWKDIFSLYNWTFWLEGEGKQWMYLSIASHPKRVALLERRIWALHDA